MDSYYVKIKETVMVLKRVNSLNIDQAICNSEKGEVIKREVISSEIIEVAKITDLEMKKDTNI